MIIQHGGGDAEVFCACNRSARGLHRVYPDQTNYNRVRLATRWPSCDDRQQERGVQSLSISPGKNNFVMLIAYVCTLPSNLYFILSNLAREYFRFTTIIWERERERLVIYIYICFIYLRWIVALEIWHYYM